MPLTTYEDFLELSGKQLTDYLSVRAWLEHFWGETNGIDSQRFFTAMELKLVIIQSEPNQSQSNLFNKLLQSNYEKN